VTRTRIKICGLTRIEDVHQCVDLGVDAVGLVFAAGSPRCLDLGTAARLANSIQGWVWRVGLFRDPDEAGVSKCLDAVDLDMLQFHGREADAFCAGFGLPYLKALSVSEVGQAGWADAYPGARAFIVDSHRPGGEGGTGRSFDWTRFPGDSARPVILAGGLSPANVGQAIASTRPWGVDVSSGVESAPGIKDPDKLRSLIEEVRRADESG